VDLREQYRRAVVRAQLTEDLTERAALQASAALLHSELYGSADIGLPVLEDAGQAPPAAAGQFSGGVIALLVEGDESVEYGDGDTAPLHATIAFVGDATEMDDTERAEMIEAARHIGQTIGPFAATPVSAATFGNDEVQIIEHPRLVEVRNLALAPPRIAARAAAAEHPLWLPHVSGLDDREEVRFDRVGAWLGKERVNFDLTGHAPVPDPPAA
jgi:hypothetical protein